MLTVADIMTRNVITINQLNTMKNAHDLSKSKGIRHLPIVSQGTGELIGIVTQKEMIAKVIGILAEFGQERLCEQEMKTLAIDIADRDFATVYEHQDVREVAAFFLEHKHGCLPCLDKNDKLVGILSSSDFVKLSIKLLEKEN
jgi:CBS domain-containing protein